MCYTANKSIYAFIVGSSVSLYLFNQSNSDLKVIGGFFFFVSFMQLFDYIFWTTNNIETNRLTTKIACVFNNIQPLVLAYLIVKYKGGLSYNLRNLVLLYGLVITVYTVSNWSSLDTTIVKKESTPSLYWEWNHWNYAEYIYVLFLIVLMTLFFYNTNSPYNYTSIILVFISFLFSYYKYRVQISYGRFWCYFAAYAPVIFLFLKR
jgi:hypothetical protein